MKKTTSILSKLALIIVLMLSLALAGKLLAQPSPPAGTPVIKLTTSTAGAAVRILMRAAENNTPVWIETAPGTYETTTVNADLAGTPWVSNWIGWPVYTPTGNSLKVYGALIWFSCSGRSTDNRNPVSAIDASGNIGLQQLGCTNCQLTNLNVQGLTQLESLSCDHNPLVNLTLTNLPALQTLSCDYNQLGNLTLTNLPVLKHLSCDHNQLTNLNVSSLTNLKVLWCLDNQLTNLNVSGLTQLIDFRCSLNQLVSLTLTNLPALQTLVCYDNQLTSLDLQGLTQLKSLWCGNNPLGNLDVQSLTQLESLSCDNNQLTNLNVSGLINLRTLWCRDNQLTNLDIQGLTQLRGLRCYGNPCTSTALGLDEIYCQLPERDVADSAKIYVSRQDTPEPFILATTVANANAKNWKVRGFNTSDGIYEITNTTGNYVCYPPAGTPAIELTTDEVGATVRMRMQAAVANTPVWIETAPNTYTRVKVGTDWTDAYCTPEDKSLKVYGAITQFACLRRNMMIGTTPVSSIDASGNTGLELLSCFSSRLTNLNVQGLTQLKELHCSSSQLSSLDLTGLSALQSLSCENNQLSSLDLTDLTALKTLYCYSNPCTSTALGLDEIYCQLPERDVADSAKIYVSEESRFNLEDFVSATTVANANTKNWKLYSNYKSEYEITNTTGKYVCDSIPVTGVTLSPTTLAIKKDESATLIATVLPADATNKAVNWSSDNRDVAKVDSLGKVTGFFVGTATITVKTEEGGFTATCLVTVYDTFIPVTDVTLDKIALTVTKGENGFLTATVLPADATNKSVIWSSDNPDVATVDDVGKITALDVGTATITVKTEDGGKTATCLVTVRIPVTGVTLDKTVLIIKKGESISLTATVLPADATNKALNWSSDRPKVATVDNLGKVTGLTVGTATITVKTEDGDKTASCLVTVDNDDSVEEIITSGINFWTLNGILHINFKESTLSDRVVSIFDMSGKLVYINSALSDELQIYLPSGVYIVKVGGIAFKVLIIQ